MHSKGAVEYENEDIPKIHLPTDEPLWHSSTTECSERVTHVTDYLRTDHHIYHNGKGTGGYQCSYHILNGL